MWPGEPVPTDAKLSFPGSALASAINSLMLFGGHRGIGHQDLRNLSGEADRDEVLFDVERQLVVELRIDGVRRQREQHGVAIGSGLGGEVGAEVACRPASILDDDRLAECFASGSANDAARQCPCRPQADKAPACRIERRGIVLAASCAPTCTGQPRGAAGSPRGPPATAGFERIRKPSMSAPA